MDLSPHTHLAVHPVTYIPTPLSCVVDLNRSLSFLSWPCILYSLEQLEVEWVYVCCSTFLLPPSSISLIITQERTLFVWGFDKTTSLDELIEYFENNFRNVVNIRQRTKLTKNRESAEESGEQSEKVWAFDAKSFPYQLSIKNSSFQWPGKCPHKFQLSLFYCYLYQSDNWSSDFQLSHHSRQNFI